MALDSRVVANKILQSAWDQGLSLTKMQLIKLVYFVHGWSLVLLDSPAVEDMPQAWQRGPVYPKLYRALSNYRSQPVNQLLADKQTQLPFNGELENDGQGRLIADITGSYGGIHAFVLSEKTHADGTPWDLTFNTLGQYAEIDESLMDAHFEELREARQIDPNHYR